MPTEPTGLVVDSFWTTSGNRDLVYISGDRDIAGGTIIRVRWSTTGDCPNLHEPRNGNFFSDVTTQYPDSALYFLPTSLPSESVGGRLSSAQEEASGEVIALVDCARESQPAWWTSGGEIRVLVADTDQLDIAVLFAQGIDLLDTPQNVAAVVGAEVATVSWDAVTGATGYQVQSSVDQLNWIARGRVAGTSTVITALTAGQLYYFRVRAISDIAFSLWSDGAASGTPSVAQLLPTLPSGTVEVPGSFVRGRDFTWHVKTILNEFIELDPADLGEFVIDWGASYSPSTQPHHFFAFGELLLNTVLPDAELDEYQQLIISAGATVYFVIAITSYVVESEERRTRLKLSSLGSLAAELPYVFQYIPDPNDVGLLDSDAPPDSIPLRVESGAPWWGVKFVTSADPEDVVRIETTNRQFIRLMENWASLVLVEEIRQPSASWLGLRLPLGDGDTRSAAGEITAANTIVLPTRYKVRRSVEWAADCWTVEFQTDPFVLVTRATVGIGFVRSGFASTSQGIHARNGNHGFVLGPPNPGDGTSFYKAIGVTMPALLRAGEGDELNEFFGFAEGYSDRADSGSPSFPSTPNVALTDDHRYFIHAYGTGSRPNSRQTWHFRMKWWKAQGGSGTIRRQALLANAKIASARRPLTRPRITYLDEDANIDLLQKIIDAWDVWSPRTLSMVMIVGALKQGDSDSVVDRVPGERVTISIDEFDGDGIITRCTWKMTGDKPLQVKWDVVKI